MLLQMRKSIQLGCALNVLNKRQQLTSSVYPRFKATTSSASKVQNQSYERFNISNSQVMKANIGELSSVLQLITRKEASDELVSLIEERLLSLIALSNKDSEFDMVGKYLSGTGDYSYSSLCDLISSLAILGRRPTPLLKAITDQLLILPREICGPNRPKQESLIITLNSLVKLSYINRALVAKLINDLTESIELTQLSPYRLCTLLRTLALIKWRPVRLMKMIYSHIKAHDKDPSRVNHQVIVNFLQASALLNFRVDDNIKHFYEDHMAGERELQLVRDGGKWLSYVYSLICLGVANESHIRSVLSQEFFHKLNQSPPLLQSHKLKLLNIKALAEYELKLKDLDCSHLEEFRDDKITRKAVVERSVDKVYEALNSVTSSPNAIRKNIRTPFGFIIDCELFLDSNLEPIPLEQIDFCSPDFHPSQVECPKYCHRCAIIVSPYEDTISNSLNEVVGYKRIISRILRSLNYDTIFLSENLINQPDTSSELSLKLVKIFKSILLRGSTAIKEI